MRISTPSVRAASTKPGGGDRLAGRGRVAEAVAALGARVVRGRRRQVVGLAVLVELDGEVVVVLFVLARRAPRRRRRRCRRCRSRSSARFLDRGDQLGEHPGERVDLVAAQLGARGEARRLLGQHPLEPEHQRVPHLPLGRRLGRGRRPSRRARPRARCRIAEPGRTTSSGSSSGSRKGSPAQASARRAAARMPSGASHSVGDCVSVSCMGAVRLGAAFTGRTRGYPLREPHAKEYPIGRRVMCARSVSVQRCLRVRLRLARTTETRSVERDVHVEERAGPSPGRAWAARRGRVSPGSVGARDLQPARVAGAARSGRCRGRGRRPTASSQSTVAPVNRSDRCREERRHRAGSRSIPGRPG